MIDAGIGSVNIKFVAINEVDGMANALKVGDKLPPFQLKDHKGFDVTNHDISGIPLVLFFFQDNEGADSSTVACAFRDNLAKFDKKRVLVIGISPESVQSNMKLHSNFQLVYTLLNDEKKELSEALGIVDKNGDVIRSTFILDANGFIKWLEKPVEVKGHVDKVLNAVKEHCKTSIPPAAELLKARKKKK